VLSLTNLEILSVVMSKGRIRSSQGLRVGDLFQVEGLLAAVEESSHEAART